MVKNNKYKRIPRDKASRIIDSESQTPGYLMIPRCKSLWDETVSHAESIHFKLCS